MSVFPVLLAMLLSILSILRYHLILISLSRNQDSKNWTQVGMVWRALILDSGILDNISKTWANIKFQNKSVVPGKQYIGQNIVYSGQYWEQCLGFGGSDDSRAYN